MKRIAAIVVAIAMVLALSTAAMAESAVDKYESALTGTWETQDGKTFAYPASDIILSGNGSGALYLTFLNDILPDGEATFDKCGKTLVLIPSSGEYVVCSKKEEIFDAASPVGEWAAFVDYKMLNLYFMEDGTCKLTFDGEEKLVTWAMADGVITLSDGIEAFECPFDGTNIDLRTAIDGADVYAFRSNPVGEWGTIFHGVEWRLTLGASGKGTMEHDGEVIALTWSYEDSVISVKLSEEADGDEMTAAFTGETISFEEQSGPVFTRKW